MKYFLNKRENIYKLKNSDLKTVYETGGLRKKKIFKKNKKNNPIITIITVVKDDKNNIEKNIRLCWNCWGNEVALK